MNKLIAASFCLMFAASPLALAQGKSADKKSGPMSQKELAEQKQAINKQSAECAGSAQRQNLKQGSKEFVTFMTQCLHQKK